uniref:F-box/LRR-repeat protein 15/At3g58940/PEG3-like LRR domain-containing protein n=1 Tax=Aegilops tauschii subsp. strangulata TaxID=200361 RepID=A0A453AJ57_AEGTS
MTPMAPRKRARYCCGLCGLPKKGHVCRFAGGPSSARQVQGREEAAPPMDPPSAGAKKEEVTIITALPNDVLGTIISALPIDEGARTHAISKGWKHLWRDYTPLNLDDRDLHKMAWTGDNLVDLISDILEAPREVRARRVSISTLCRHSGDRDRYPIFDRWFRSKVLDRLEDFHFSYQRVNNTEPLQAGETMPPLPPSALSFSSLRVASFGCCHFPENILASGGITFPHLVELTLSRITNSENTLHAMIAASPILVNLYLHRNYHFRRVHISSQTIVRFRMFVDPDGDVMEELLIVNTPSLEEVMLWDQGYCGPRIIRVLVAPKLHILGCLHSDMMSTVQHGKTILQVYM